MSRDSHFKLADFGEDALWCANRFVAMHKPLLAAGFAALGTHRRSVDIGNPSDEH